MYGIVEVAGHQYKVKAGDLIDVDKLAQEAGTDLKLDSVLFVSGENAQVGTPTIAGASVTAKVLKHDRSKKVIIFKRKPGGRRSKNGHRQHYTSLLVTEVSDGQGNTETIDKESKNAKKFLK